MKTIYADKMRKILENHYEWCKKEGRDISWYNKYKEKQNGNK